MLDKKFRSFRIISISHDDGVPFENGIYHGRGPGQAALKAFNWYCRKTGLDNCTRRFTIEEITLDKSRKQFHYIGSRKKLDEPKKIVRQGKEYNVEYYSSIHKAV